MTYRFALVHLFAAFILLVTAAASADDRALIRVTPQPVDDIGGESWVAVAAMTAQVVDREPGEDLRLGRIVVRDVGPGDFMDVAGVAIGQDLDGDGRWVSGRDRLIPGIPPIIDMPERNFVYSLDGGVRCRLGDPDSQWGAVAEWWFSDQLGGPGDLVVDAPAPQMWFVLYQFAADAPSSTWQVEFRASMTKGWIARRGAGYESVVFAPPPPVDGIITFADGTIVNLDEEWVRFSWGQQNDFDDFLGGFDVAAWFNGHLPVIFEPFTNGSGLRVLPAGPTETGTVEPDHAGVTVLDAELEALLPNGVGAITVSGVTLVVRAGQPEHIDRLQLLIDADGDGEPAQLVAEFPGVAAVEPVAVSLPAIPVAHGERLALRVLADFGPIKHEMAYAVSLEAVETDHLVYGAPLVGLAWVGRIPRDPWLRVGSRPVTASMAAGERGVLAVLELDAIDGPVQWRSLRLQATDGVAQVELLLDRNRNDRIDGDDTLLASAGLGTGEQVLAPAESLPVNTGGRARVMVVLTLSDAATGSARVTVVGVDAGGLPVGGADLPLAWTADVVAAGADDGDDEAAPAIGEPVIAGAGAGCSAGGCASLPLPLLLAGLVLVCRRRV